MVAGSAKRRTWLHAHPLDAIAGTAEVRRAARTDANHGEIIEAFRKCGFTVYDTSRLGGGFGDCVIAKLFRTAIVEIKDGTKPPSQRILTQPEQKFRDTWAGRYEIVESLMDVERVNRTWVSV